MAYLNSYISKLKDNNLIDTIKRTSNEVCSHIEEKFHFNEQLTGLLLGNVQSGKTGQMLGIISSLADRGYRLFILLTTDNIDLQRQTYTRVKTSLTEFNVISEKDEVLFQQSGLTKPIVIVLKKNSSVLKKWRNTLLNSKTCTGLSLVIFDDEGDAASLNTLVNRHKKSTINQHLSDIKRTATASIYIEVTATPQAILLQSEISGWQPSFITYFKPGDGYLGGNYFYSRPQSFCIKYTNEFELDEVIADDDNICPKGLSESLMSFLVVCAYKKYKGESNCNFMIHPSVKIDIHRKFVNRTEEFLNLLQNSTDDVEFDCNLKLAWTDLHGSKPDLPHYEDIKDCVIQILDDTEISVIPLNSKSFICRDSNNPDALDLSKGFNIVIGGNTLGRGITFPHLQTVYYCRNSKTPQADTFWQHSRIFGYDRDPSLVRVFIPQSLYQLFVNLNESNEILIKQIEKGVNNIQVIYPNHIKPTRKSVMDIKYLDIITGGSNMFSSEPLSINTQVIDSLIERYCKQESVVVSEDILVDILNLVKVGDESDFNNTRYISCINALREKRPSINFRLIVRTDRNISKGTGTLLSPNDRKLGDIYPNDVILTMYRVNGHIENGWAGDPLWIPNIKFPHDVSFYDVVNH